MPTTTLTMPIKLSLPKVADTLDPAIEVRPVYVEEWVESLAYANPPTLLDQTLQSVEALNRQPLKPSLRIDLLDLHIRPYAFALEFRRTQDPAQSGATLARQRAVSRRLRLCAVAISLGYKQALSELQPRKNRFGGNRDLRRGLQRSVLFSSLALLHCYDEYRPTEPRLWLEVIALYKVAAKDGIDAETVPAPLDDPAFSQSTADCFKRLCLTSLVDPYHLAYGELWSVYGAFGEYAGSATVGEIGDSSRPAGLFVVDPARDARPSPLSQVREPPGPHCRLLDANPVLATLRARHARATGDPLASHVLAAMVRALGLPPRRHTPRESSDGRVKVAAGLGTVHHFMGGRYLDARPRTSSGDDIVVSDARGLADDPGDAYRHEAWEVANEGPGGVGILRHSKPSIPLGVGELVSMQFPLRGDTEDEWTLGVVRWMNIENENDYQAGVQTLTETVSAVMAYSESVTDTITRIPRPTLALPAIDADPASTLVTPRGMFARGNRLRVSAGNQSWLVEAVALSESTSTYDRFTFRVIEGT